MPDNISIIIPILNEAKTIGSLIEYLSENSTAGNVAEIIVVDGGSTDDSPKIVSKFINDDPLSESYFDLNSDVLVLEKATETHLKINTEVLLIKSEKGRAKQLNAGARLASGQILYFLHADSFPPKNYDSLIIEEVNNGNQAGCFRMQFDSSHWWLRLASWLTKFSWRACRGGDQSQYITRELFNEIGGYDETYIIYEDNVLINELYARREFTVIDAKLRTSARMYKKYGVWKVQFHFFVIYIKKWFGASADELFKYYKRTIGS